MAREYTFRDFRILLRQNGYVFNRCNGDHIIFTNDINTISVPYDGKQLNRMITRRLIKENNLKEN